MPCSKVPCSLIVMLALFGTVMTWPAYARKAERTDPIVLPIENDTGTDLVTKIIGSTLERVGYRVEYVDADYTATFSGIKTGDLQLSICWESTWEVCSASLEGGKAMIIGTTGIATEEGWWYPKYLKDYCPGLPDWEALKEESCVKALATAETSPKARFVEGPADWVMYVGETIEAFQLNFRPIASGSGGALLATFEGAMQRKEPIIGWGYIPHWFYASDEGEFVKFPAYEPECQTDPSWGMNKEKTFDCNIPTGYLWIFANTEFIKSAPFAARILYLFRLKTSDLTEPMKEVDVNGKSLDEVVEAWMNANEETWRSWID